MGLRPYVSCHLRSNVFQVGTQLATPIPLGMIFLSATLHRESLLSTMAIDKTCGPKLLRQTRIVPRRERKVIIRLIYTSDALPVRRRQLG